MTNDTPIDPNREYTPDEASPLVGRAPETVRKWCRNGTVKGRRAGRWLHLIPGSELIRIRANLPEPGNPDWLALRDSNA